MNNQMFTGLEHPRWGQIGPSPAFDLRKENNIVVIHDSGGRIGRACWQGEHVWTSGCIPLPSAQPTQRPLRRRSL